MGFNWYPEPQGAGMDQGQALAGSVPSPFEVCEAGDIRALIEAYPLAWVQAVDAGEASLLPMIGVFDGDDRLVELIGHFGRTNPLHAAFLEHGRASILFTGPQGYISPSQAGRRNWGPTWNYAQVQVEAEVSVESDLTPEAVDLLVDHVEKDRAEPWSAAELGERYDLLMPMIIGFRARVTGLKAVFKLGQTEDDQTFRAIMANLPEGDLKAWMRRFDHRGEDAKEEGE